MNKSIKRNKNKVWRKTYGKPFIKRKAFGIAQMAVIAAQGQAKLSAMASCGVPPSVVMVSKAVAIAQTALSTAKAIADKSSEINKGFCN